jgi:hypothetical protein
VPVPFLIALLAAAPPAALPIRGVVSGSASAASRGGAGAVDHAPGSQTPMPSIVGDGPASRPVVDPPRCQDGMARRDAGGCRAPGTRGF